MSEETENMFWQVQMGLIQLLALVGLNYKMEDRIQVMQVYRFLNKAKGNMDGELYFQLNPSMMRRHIEQTREYRPLSGSG